MDMEKIFKERLNVALSNGSIEKMIDETINSNFKKIIEESCGGYEIKRKISSKLSDILGERYLVLQEHIKKFKFDINTREMDEYKKRERLVRSHRYGYGSGYNIDYTNVPENYYEFDINFKLPHSITLMKVDLDSMLEQLYSIAKTKEDKVYLESLIRSYTEFRHKEDGTYDKKWIGYR